MKNQKPQVVTWHGAEWLLHQAALHRGHHEALADVGANLKRAADSYRAQIAAVPSGASPEDWQKIADHFLALFESMGGQFSVKAAESSGKAQSFLTQACVAKMASGDQRLPTDPPGGVHGLFSQPPGC